MKSACTYKSLNLGENVIEDVKINVDMAVVRSLCVLTYNVLYLYNEMYKVFMHFIYKMHILIIFISSEYSYMF